MIPGSSSASNSTNSLFPSVPLFAPAPSSNPGPSPFGAAPLLGAAFGSVPSATTSIGPIPFGSTAAAPKPAAFHPAAVTGFGPSPASTNNPLFGSVGASTKAPTLGLALGQTPFQTQAPTTSTNVGFFLKTPATTTTSLATGTAAASGLGNLMAAPTVQPSQPSTGIGLFTSAGAPSFAFAPLSSAGVGTSGAATVGTALPFPSTLGSSTLANSGSIPVSAPISQAFAAPSAASTVGLTLGQAPALSQSALLPLQVSLSTTVPTQGQPQVPGVPSIQPPLQSQAGQLGLPPAGQVAGPGVGLAQGIQVPAHALAIGDSMSFAQLEQLLQAWDAQLEGNARRFEEQARELAAWDLALFEQGHALSGLTAEVDTLRVEQRRLDDQLDTLLREQSQLEHMLDPLETHVAQFAGNAAASVGGSGTLSLAASADSAQRARIYELTCDLERQGGDLSKQLQSLQLAIEMATGESAPVEESSGEAANGAESSSTRTLLTVTRLLNAHLTKMQSLERTCNDLTARAEHLSLQLPDGRQLLQ